MYRRSMGHSFTCSLRLKQWDVRNWPSVHTSSAARSADGDTWKASTRSLRHVARRQLHARLTLKLLEAAWVRGTARPALHTLLDLLS